MCPRIRLPGHVVAAGCPVRRSLAINGGDNRSSLVVMAASVYFCLEAGRAASPTALSSGAVVLVPCMEPTGPEA